jgi:hypothetical protein
VGFHAHQQRERAVFQFHHHALERFLGLFVRDFQQLQDHGLVLAQHFAGGDAKQQGVTNLTSCASDGNANGLFAHGKTPGSVVKPALGTGDAQAQVREPAQNAASLPLKTRKRQFVLCLI